MCVFISYPVTKNTCTCVCGLDVSDERNVLQFGEEEQQETLQSHWWHLNHTHSKHSMTQHSNGKLISTYLKCMKLHPILLTWKVDSRLYCVCMWETNFTLTYPRGAKMDINIWLHGSSNTMSDTNLTGPEYTSCRLNINTALMVSLPHINSQLRK